MRVILSNKKLKIPPPPVLQTNEVASLDTTSTLEEEAISPLAVYSGTCGANLTWTLDTDTGVLAITGTGDMLIPENPMDGGNPIWTQYHASVTSVELPNGLTSIAPDAFTLFSRVTSITIPDTVTAIGHRAFSGTSITSIDFPDHITTLDFLGGMLFTSYTIPDTVTVIGSDAFTYCTSLSSITIPSSVTSIGDTAFAACFSLSSITIPDSVTSIGMGAFYQCSSLRSLTIPASITSMGFWTFGECRVLNEVIFTSSAAPTMDADAFNSIPSGGTIYYPAGATGYTDTWKNAVTELQSWLLVQSNFQADTDGLVFGTQTVGTAFDAQTITVSAQGLTQGISGVISGDDASSFVLDTASLSSTGGTFSVTFAPATAGSHSATLTLSSQGAENVVIILSGTANAVPVPDSPATDPPAQDNATGALPQTGDITNNNSLLFFVALVASGGALVLLAFRAKRRKTT